MKITGLVTHNLIPQGRMFPCRVIAVSSGVSGGGLLVKQIITGSQPGGVLLLLLLVAYFMALRLVRLHLADPLTQMMAGFLINAGGWLALLLGLQQDANGAVVLVGVVMAGMGQGVVSRSLTGLTLPPQSKLQTMIMVVGCLLSVAICLGVGALYDTTEGMRYAVALLIDLSLLGALYTKIVREDQGA